MLRRHGLATIALAIVALFGLSSVAQASTTVSKLDLSLSPSKAGTKKKPKGVKLNFHLTLGTDDGTSPPDDEGDHRLVRQGHQVQRLASSRAARSAS